MCLKKEGISSGDSPTESKTAVRVEEASISEEGSVLDRMASFNELRKDAIREIVAKENSPEAVT